eukprot:TRINITY_DN21155_c0_g1_i1.p1 TRINITY_DN21155_c0_g1~~TRINITY_DN21155_c0_g1_i1.p1  ORF type:complete len:613 (+),score=120.89 TRINITY_DN21155_c0_g1_i1:40-1878(+)
MYTGQYTTLGVPSYVAAPYGQNYFASYQMLVPPAPAASPLPLWNAAVPVSTQSTYLAGAGAALARASLPTGAYYGSLWSSPSIASAFPQPVLSYYGSSTPASWPYASYSYNYGYSTAHPAVSFGSPTYAPSLPSFAFGNGFFGGFSAPTVFPAANFASPREELVAGQASDALDRVQREFEVPWESLSTLMDVIDDQMNKGLTAEGSSMYMLPSFITRSPNYEEEGDFVGLDLGGTNARVVRCRLESGKVVNLEVEQFAVPPGLMVGTGEALFDFLASCVEKAAPIPAAGAPPLALGFTFSFGAKQKSVDSGEIFVWTKGFDIPDAIGKDAVQMLREALARKGLSDSVKVVALVNDTVGTLISGQFDNSRTVCGIIIGTGTNMCYPEEIARIEKLDDATRQAHSDATHMVINTEWGALGGRLDSEILPRNRFDHLLDTQSLHPNEMLFEKMISGLYLGELTRLVFVDLLKSDAFSVSELSELEVKGSLYSSDLSEILDDERPALQKTAGIFRRFGLENPTENDSRLAREVVEIVITRAARLVAAGIATVVRRLNRTEAAIAIDGSLFEKVPFFQRELKEAVRTLTNQDIELYLSKDGSGRGAALAAAVCNEQA